MGWGTTLYILEISKKAGISFTVFGVHPLQARWNNLSTNAFVCQLTQLHVIITTDFFYIRKLPLHMCECKPKKMSFFVSLETPNVVEDPP